MRWEQYVIGRGDEAITLLRAAHSSGPTTCFVLGAGFDPRSLIAIRAYVDSVAAPVQVIRIELPSAGDQEELGELAEAHQQGLAELVDAGKVDLISVPYPVDADMRSAGLSISRRLQESVIPAESSVVVDVSALPSHVFFPMIGGLLSRADGPQLQVIACENPQLDGLIREEGATDPGPLSGFSAGIARETEGPSVRVWAPVIGEGHGAQLGRIHDYLRPDEVCPVLPFPARDPRRADNLTAEHRVLLVDTIAIEPRNVIYADEGNPFDLYRALTRLRLRYVEALAPLGNVTVVTSVHASKLLAVGALLAAWEGRMPVVACPPTEYSLATTHEVVAPLEGAVTCLWLAGDPYEP